MVQYNKFIVLVLITYSSVSLAKVNCFQKLHGLFSQKARVSNQARSVVEFNHDSASYINEFEELLTKIRNWSQVGGRGQTIHSMRETGAKQRLNQLMKMSSTSEVVGQLESFVKIPDMAYFTALKYRRHFEAFKHFKGLVQDNNSIEEFKQFASFVALVRKEIKLKEILNDNAYEVFLKVLDNKKSLDDVIAKVKSEFSWLKEDEIKAEVEKLHYLFKSSEFARECSLATSCYSFASQLPKVFSFDFSPFMTINRPSSLFKAIDKELETIELNIVAQAAKLYRHKAEYVSIRENLQLFFPKELLDNKDALYQLGHSANKKMNRLDEIRRLLHGEDSEFDDFKRELTRFRKEFPEAPEVRRFSNVDLDDTNLEKEVLKEEFDRSYFTVKASVVWYKFEPRFNLQKFGNEIGVKIELMSPGQIFQINDQFPASKIKVLRESLHTEKVSAIVTLLPDETVYRILNKVSDLVTWIPGLRDSKAEIKGFFQALIDEKAILKTYPKVDELAYGPGTLAQKYKTFKEAAAPNSLGAPFVDIFARRADEQAQHTYDKFFKMLEDEIKTLESIDVTSYANFKKNHPLIKLFEQMKKGREQLHTKGNLAPWFENPPNSARYFRLFASGALVGATSYGGYKLISWLTTTICESVPGIPASVCSPVEEEVVERINEETMRIVEEEAEAVGIDVEAIEADGGATVSGVPQ